MQSLESTAARSRAGSPLTPARHGRIGAPKQWRLWTRISLVVVALVVAVEVIVGWTGLASLEERRATELEHAVLVGQAIAAVVDGFAADLQSTTLSTAIALGVQPGPLDPATVSEHLRSIAAQYPSLRSMFLTDTDGRVIASGTDDALGLDLSLRPYIVPLQSGAASVWTGGIPGILTGETTVAFGRSVRGADGSVRAFLVGAFYPQRLVEGLPVSLPPEARVTVIDDRGAVLYDSDASTSPRPHADDGSIQSALDGKIIQIAGQTAPGGDEARFGALVPVPRLGWAVGYTLPRAAVEATLARRSAFQAGGIALVILVAASVFVMILRRLTQPLTMLAKTADAIARGERPAVPDVQSASEVQQLALAMQLMGTAVAEREEALRESEARLRLAVEAAPVVLFNHDRELRYTWVGKPFAGLAPEALLGQSDAAVFPPAMADAAIAIKRRAFEDGERAEGEIELPGAGPAANTGTTRWHLTAEPVRDGNGSVVGITCAALDVTERRALERLQQEFISLVSHELRNPLASVKGYAQLMLRRGFFHEPSLRSIVEQSDHLDRLISDLLDSSRVEAGRLELRLQRVDLAELLASCVERIQTRTEGHTIRLTVPDERLVGQWDAQRLDQVITNVLTNAIKYAPDGGEIVVSAERRADDVEIAVRDQGVGIAPEQLPHVFDRFYRVTATAPAVQGLGIGLYIARELVEAHGGRIWAESAGPGHGTTMRLTLPLDVPATERPPGSRPVLVVDDDDALRQIIAATLRDEGYRPETARDGVEALDRVAAEPPALILLDWTMPRLDGAAFATALRQRHPELDVPIVVMTAGGVSHERAASIGAEGFISKPFELAALVDRVSRHIDRRTSA